MQSFTEYMKQKISSGEKIFPTKRRTLSWGELRELEKSFLSPEELLSAIERSIDPLRFSGTIEIGDEDDDEAPLISDSGLFRLSYEFENYQPSKLELDWGLPKLRDDVRRIRLNRLEPDGSVGSFSIRFPLREEPMIMEEGIVFDRLQRAYVSLKAHPFNPSDEVRLIPHQATIIESYPYGISYRNIEPESELDYLDFDAGPHISLF